MINDKGEFGKVSKIRKKKIKKTNILLGFICILLAVLLGFILVTSYKSEQKESRHLSEIADDQQSGIEDYEAVKERAKELEEISSEEAEDTEDIKSKNTEDTKDTEKTDTADTEDADKTEDTKDKTTAASGIVCWGDDLINGEESNTYSYMTVLQKLLTDNGYNMTVINKTLQGGGTLSMMKMAGVSDETIQSYITKHQQAANGAQLNVTETGIRDLTEEQTTRNDMDCIPVIFMGYYGGWNHDPAELADQQEQILNTFQNKDQFIVVGTRPMDGSVTSEALDLLNQVRVRAKLNPYTMGDVKGVDDFLQKVLDERGHELWFEGVRRSDLIRHGQFIQNARDRGCTTTKDEFVLFPLPQAVINEGKGKIVQNPGY